LTPQCRHLRRHFHLHLASYLRQTCLCKGTMHRGPIQNPANVTLNRNKRTLHVNAKKNVTQITEKPEIVTWPETITRSSKRSARCQDTDPQAWKETSINAFPHCRTQPDHQANKHLQGRPKNISRRAFTVAAPQKSAAGTCNTQITEARTARFVLTGPIPISPSLRPRFQMGPDQKTPPPRRLQHETTSKDPQKHPESDRNALPSPPNPNPPVDTLLSRSKGHTPHAHFWLSS